MDTHRWIEEQVREHEAALCRYAYSLCGSVSDARDAVQETFLRLCRCDPDRVRGHEAAWLFRVCRTRVLDQKRKEKPVSPLTPHQETSIADPGPDPAAAAATREAVGLLPRLLNRLPANQREALRLKFQQHLSYKDIAEITGQPVGTVGYLIHEGLRALRTDLHTLEGVSS